jgi:ribosomal protein S13
MNPKKPSEILREINMHSSKKVEDFLNKFEELEHNHYNSGGNLKVNIKTLLTGASLVLAAVGAAVATPVLASAVAPAAAVTLALAGMTSMVGAVVVADVQKKSLKDRLMKVRDMTHQFGFTKNTRVSDLSEQQVDILSSLVQQSKNDLKVVDQINTTGEYKSKIQNIRESIFGKPRTNSNKLTA